jgi:hypothetical protein
MGPYLTELPGYFTTTFTQIESYLNTVGTQNFYRMSQCVNDYKDFLRSQFVPIWETFVACKNRYSSAAN